MKTILSQIKYLIIHDHDWIEKAKNLDVIVGISSCSSFDLEELRNKYHILETELNKFCFPSKQDILLYENKFLEAELSKVYENSFYSNLCFIL